MQCHPVVDTNVIERVVSQNFGKGSDNPWDVGLSIPMLKYNSFNCSAVKTFVHNFSVHWLALENVGLKID